ncbi:Mitochondrial nuclease [Smittium mucronatum]|uniref:Endonuclease n=1 Tax=Smittium mucronatum TaxID=133383 RepID=A0A1R0GS83_9FUNG|nr:Mitochondrial nuclease [Smittium mucronatum]
MFFKPGSIIGASFFAGGAGAYALYRQNKNREVQVQETNMILKREESTSPASSADSSKAAGSDTSVPPVTSTALVLYTGGSGGIVPEKNKSSGSPINVGLESLRYGFPGPINDSGVRQSYAYSYNRMMKNPNWIAEHLTRDTIKGPADRQKSKFREDSSIPHKNRTHLSDYFRSGFDRGHMAPAGNSKFSQQAMDETFILSNISPQVGEGFNRHYWAFFESFIRDLTNRYKHVYVITGPLYLPSHDPKTNKWTVTYQVIGNPPNIPVPTHFFKAVLATNNEPSPVSPTSSSNKEPYFMQAFVIPNSKVLNETPLQNFITPIDAVERATGLELFSSIDRKKDPVSELCSHTVCKVKIDPRYID